MNKQSKGYIRILSLVIFFALLAGVGVLLFATKQSDIYVTWNGNRAEVSPAKIDGVKISVDGGDVKINMKQKGKKEVKIHLQGKSDCGSFTYDGKRNVHLILENLSLRNDSGYAIKIKNKKPSFISVPEGSVNALADEGIMSKSDLTINGKGTLNIMSKGVGHKGIRCEGDLVIKGKLFLNITTSGKPEKMVEMKMPEQGQPMPLMAQGNQPIPQGNQPVQPGKQPLPQGNAPMPQAPKVQHKGVGPGMPPPFVRYDYSGSAKAIKVLGSVTINGGTINIKTSSPGAEGIEAKKALTINGGVITVEAYDDGISVGEQMTVTDGTLTVKSSHNDGIDINDKGKNIKFRYVQTGGIVKTTTTAGPPEDGLDTDNTPIQHTGGTLTIIPTPHQPGPPMHK